MLETQAAEWWWGQEDWQQQLGCLTDFVLEETRVRTGCSDWQCCQYLTGSFEYEGTSSPSLRRLFDFAAPGAHWTIFLLVWRLLRAVRSKQEVP